MDRTHVMTGSIRGEAGTQIVGCQWRQTQEGKFE